MRGIIISIIMLISSCTVLPPTLHTEGEIVHAEPDRIFVIFKDAFQTEEWKAVWFYLPGAGVVDKDKYRVEMQLQPKTDHER